MALLTAQEPVGAILLEDVPIDEVIFGHLHQTDELKSTVLDVKGKKVVVKT